jgi:malate synthase
MEDLATARMSVAQIAQRVLHAAVCQDTTRVHTVGRQHKQFTIKHCKIK